MEGSCRIHYRGEILLGSHEVLLSICCYLQAGNLLTVIPCDVFKDSLHETVYRVI